MIYQAMLTAAFVVVFNTALDVLVRFVQARFK